MLIPFDQLFRQYEINAPGVLHLGAHIGQEKDAYRDAGVQQVIWVEACPDTYSRLVKEIAHYSGHTALCACVGEEDGREVTFHIASNAGQSSSYLELGTHLIDHPTVRYVREIPMKTVRVETLLQQQGLKVGPNWFLNLDLQGAELAALMGMGDLLWEFDHVYVEVNVKKVYKGCPLVQDIDEYLHDFGFEGKTSKMTGAGWGDKYYGRADWQC